MLIDKNKLPTYDQKFWLLWRRKYIDLSLSPIIIEFEAIIRSYLIYSKQILIQH